MVMHMCMTIMCCTHYAQHVYVMVMHSVYRVVSHRVVVVFLPSSAPSSAPLMPRGSAFSLAT
jgi:hypothetical protein